MTYYPWIDWAVIVAVGIFCALAWRRALRTQERLDDDVDESDLAYLDRVRSRNDAYATFLQQEGASLEDVGAGDLRFIFGMGFVAGEIAARTAERVRVATNRNVRYGNKDV